MKHSKNGHWNVPNASATFPLIPQAIFRVRCAKNISTARKVRSSAMNAMRNSRRTRAVVAESQESAKRFRKHPSSRTAHAAPNSAWSARKDDGKGKYAWWSIVENSLRRKTYPQPTRTNQVDLSFVNPVFKMDAQRKIQVSILVLLVRKWPAAMGYFKASISNRQQREEHKDAKAACHK